MNFGLVIVGDEILSGKRADKHLPKVIELLAARGLALSWARYVGDDRERITADAASDAFASGDVGVLVRRHRRDARRPHAPVRGGGARRAARAASRRRAELILERMRDVGARAGHVPTSPDRAGQPCTASTWACSRAGAEIIPNPYNKIAGFSVRRATVHLRAGLSGDGAGR